MSIGGYLDEEKLVYLCIRGLKKNDRTKIITHRYGRILRLRRTA